MSLKPGEHQEMKLLRLEFEKGDEHSKQVYIRDELDDIFKPYLIEWRLRPMEVGIHPLNRDEDGMSPLGLWLRGGRILANGFSYKAIGKLWAFENHHPAKKTPKGIPWHAPRTIQGLGHSPQEM